MRVLIVRRVVGKERAFAPSHRDPITPKFELFQKKTNGIERLYNQTAYTPMGIRDLSKADI